VGVTRGANVGVGVVVGVGDGVTDGSDGVGDAVGVGVVVEVGVGVGVKAACAQYLPPVFKSPESPRPPHTIIWLPLQIAVWSYRAKGASVVLVGAQVSVLGLYLPPVPGGVGVGVPVGVAVGVDVGVGGVNGAPYVPP
jgi:hypothetical protein